MANIPKVQGMVSLSSLSKRVMGNFSSICSVAHAAGRGGGVVGIAQDCEGW